jgi:ribosomal protein L22
MKYAYKTEGKPCASGTFSISPLNSVKVCKAINRKKFSSAKKFLENLIAEKADLNGKHFTKTSEEILKLLNQLEKNAKNKNVDPENMYIFISAHKGPTLHRARRKWRKFGSRLKIAHVQAVLNEKNFFAKKVYATKVSPVKAEVKTEVKAK